VTAWEPATELEVELAVNGETRHVRVEARRSLAELLRDDLDLTGTHLGCEHGVCGSCTVLLDGRPVRSCLTLAVQAGGRAVTTVEGLADGDRLHPVQQGCLERHSFQCGFCTPGVLVTAAALLDEVPDPD
jgi:carbon-monoxide dehydrogenase small subunit